AHGRLPVAPPLGGSLPAFPRKAAAAIHRGASPVGGVPVALRPGATRVGPRRYLRRAGREADDPRGAVSTARGAGGGGLVLPDPGARHRELRPRRRATVAPPGRCAGGGGGARAAR